MEEDDERREVVRLNGVVAPLRSRVTELQRQLEGEQRDPINFAGVFQLNAERKGVDRTLVFSVDPNSTPSVRTPPVGPVGGSESRSWRAVQIATSAGSDQIVELRSEAAGVVVALCAVPGNRSRPDLTVLRNTDLMPSGGTKKWVLEQHDGRYIVWPDDDDAGRSSDTRWRERYFLRPEASGPELKDDDTGNFTRWTFERAANGALTEVGRARQDEVKAALTTANAELAAAELLLAAAQNRLTLATESRQEIERRLAAADQEFATTATRLAARRQTFEQTPLAQGWTLHSTDARELTTQSTTLPLRASGEARLEATRDSHVDLIGSTESGEMFRVRYDASIGSGTETSERFAQAGGSAALLLAAPHGELRLDDHIDLAGLSGWTVEIWYYHEPTVTSRLASGDRDIPLVVSGGTSSPGVHLLIRSTGAGVRVGSQFGPSSSAFRDCGAVLDTLSIGWHHVALRGSKVDGVGTTDYFIDGARVGQLDRSGDQAPSEAWWSEPIHSFGQFDRRRSAPVAIGEIRVWNGPLRDDQIETSAVTSVTGHEPGLIAWYPIPLDGADAVPNRSTARPNRHHGQLVAATTIPFTGRFGHVGHHVKPPGAAPASLARLVDTVAIDVWVRFGHVTSRPTLGDMFGGASSDRIAAVSLPNDADWHHVAVVWTTDGSAEVFVDRSLAQTVPAADPLRRSALTVGHQASRSSVARFANLRAWTDAESMWASAHRSVAQTHPSLEWSLNVVVGVPDFRLPVAFGDVSTCEQVVYARDHAFLERNWFVAGETGVEVRTGQPVAALELEWIGTAQTQPTLLGFIEGPPPVPSENLTVHTNSYAGASSVELTSEEELDRSWTRREEFGVGAELEAYFGPKVAVDAVVLKASSELKVGGKISGRASDEWESTTSVSEFSKVSDRLELVGSVETSAKFAHLGTRFVPKNVGYAVVTSGLADVFVTRMLGTGRMVSYIVRPADDVDFSSNTITFMMNPAYCMVGSLDGMTGSSAASARYFPRVEEMRRRYGSRYPASYFRLADAQRLDRDIERREKERLAFSDNFSVNLVDVVTGIGAAPLDEDATETEDIAGDVETVVDQLSGRSLPTAHTAFTREKWAKREAEILNRAAKRNIVNRYVWDADGGLRTESQSFATAIEQHYGSSVALGLQLGIEAQGSFTAIAGAAFELSYLATTDLTMSLTKSESARNVFALDVDMSGVERSGVTDFRDRPLLAGEKVDRYKFASYYLEGSVEHFHHFFDEVVDHEWLASNDEEARALRAVDRSHPTRPWRVVHRVGAVERPALMGFGSDVRGPEPQERPRQLAERADVERLGAEIELLRSEVRSLHRAVDTEP